MQTLLATNDRLEQTRETTILRFAGKRKVLSTGALGGGLRSDLTTVFNYNDCPRAGVYCEMHGDTMEEHQAWVAQSLGLDPETTTGLNTGASMDNGAVCTMAYEDFSVTAIATAGLEHNACRVGDPTTLHERDGIAKILSGTVNIILVIDADLSDRCMMRALVTCTEAKVAALQELMVSGRTGCNLATGSGTDGTIIVSNSESPVRLHEAGEQFKLGEYIGKAVSKAVKEALFRQTGLGPGMQHSVIRRLERFGVTEQAIWDAYCQTYSTACGRQKVIDMIHMMSADGSAVVFASLYAHLIDQVLWGLLPASEAVWAANQILQCINAHYAMPIPVSILCSDDPNQFVRNMADTFIQVTLHWLSESLA